MMELLNGADAKLKEEATEYTAKKGDMEKTLAERQEWSVTTFNKGKIFYDQGQVDEALGQWERLLPYLEEGTQIKERIQSLRENHNAIVAGKNSLGDPSSGERPVKLNNEEEILSVLEQADQRFKADAEATRLKQTDLEKSFEQRKAWIEDTFQKGKTYYDQGNYSKAVEEWGILGPYLGEHPKVREMIETAKKNYSEGRYAQQIIESMEAKKSALSTIPAATPPQPEAPQEDSNKDTLKLVSGEIVSVDEPEKTFTLKLFNESGTNETLTMNFDERTQVDGSSSKLLSAEKNGSSIDVRYNPQTSRALYIYVY
jgi:tetratricopeptide (TPR) repeat protein